MDNMSKGIEGEQIAARLIEQAISMAKVEAKLFQNIIFQFPSIYGKYGKLTTEIDHIVVTPYFIFIIETKNENYSTHHYLSQSWSLMNGSNVSNPIIQNHLHKMILCECLGICQRKVFTIELLLNNFDMEINTRYSNDFVMTRQNFLNYFLLLISSKDDEIIFPEITRKLDVWRKKTVELSEIHVENMKRTEDIEEWIRTHEKHYIFSRTDTVICPKCGSYLVFRDGKYPDYSRKNRKASKQYLLGCLNYRKTHCNMRVYYNKNRGEGFDAVSVQTYERRTGWTEMKTSTKNVLDEYIEQKRLIDLLYKENSEYKAKIENYEKQNVEKDRVISTLKMEIDILKNKMGEYKHVFGSFYTRK